MSDNTPLTPEERDIQPITIEEEMKSSYLDYAMSVIVSRALPDVRDGLKPVHRRILYSMHENNYEWNRPYRKSARIVGDVMGKYHPHGDSAIYDALVRLAQDFSMRAPLIDGQGNFGSMDGDSAAAMRYTEARMDKISSMILADIDKDTVNFQPNYDESESEPVVLPARFPNLLVNGGAGIAVGMATNIPPHNLREVIDGVFAVIENPDIDTLGLMEHIKGPDFPTGGIILGAGGIRSAFETGRGSVVIRSKTHVEEIRAGRFAIVITEVPYQVNKASMIEKIAECVQTKRIEGISDIRDESDRDGVRVVVELKRDTVPEVVLNQLFRFTQVQTSFGVNMLALNGGKPEQLNLKQVLEAFIDFREEVITRRTKFDLNKARDRAHIMVGLVTAVANIDEVVAIIRGAPSPAAAREALRNRRWHPGEIMDYLELINETGALNEDGTYQLSDIQVKAILDLRLHRLTALGRDEIGGELEELAARIRVYLEILQSREKLYEVLTTELSAVREEFGNDRRTEIDMDTAGAFDDEDLIAREDMVVTVTHTGYIKRVPLSTYRAQRRGGKGRSGMQTKDEDFLSTVFIADTHTPVLFFSNTGQVYKMKVWKLPLGTPQSKGKAVINLLPLQQDETIATILPLPEDEDSWGDLHVMFATAKGNVRRNRLSDFSNVMANGKIAIRFSDDDDKLIGVDVCTENDDVLLAAKGGRAIRFKAADVRLFAGRTSTGVRGMKFAEGDEVISMCILNGTDASTEERDAYLRAASWKTEPGERTLSDERMQELKDVEQFILTVTSNGFGKRTSNHEYRVTGRGGQGIWNVPSDDRLRSQIGNVVAVFPITDDEQVMMVTDQGKLIRTPVHDVRIAARNTKGVTLFKVSDDETIVSVAKLQETDEEEASENNSSDAGSEASEANAAPDTNNED
ncbi:DNA gyrase subunit A [Kordiimonas sp. SCSIO 12610]|uniref:DNA gyrase subunit A n=1 Tax=Kordiimonas sp. SCSIO 12610 TaxID=2829597 RepID=UPI00210B0AE7|nr:DNA gyrase subunit A [Kordiimonas sp. SCSIO 12610]UTW53930.1 DNA gyrase subunit A [Kordiimonas sp. SCSIO 12610]